MPHSSHLRGSLFIICMHVQVVPDSFSWTSGTRNTYSIAKNRLDYVGAAVPAVTFAMGPAAGSASDSTLYSDQVITGSNVAIPDVYIFSFQ